LHNNQQQVLRVGIMTGVDEEIFNVVKKTAWDQYHLKIEVVKFSDYILPNAALNNGDIDANIFQHQPYLAAQIKARHYNLTSIAKTFIYPLGFYSHQYQSLKDLPNGASIAIPNDPSNEGRALLLLEKSGLIHLANGVGLKATQQDIVANPHQFKFIAMDAAQIPRVLADVALGALTNDYVGPAGFKVNQALLKEGADSPYANIIVARTQDKDQRSLKALVAVMHSAPVLNKTLQIFPDGAAIPAWES
jgi:D-methionine transport system substrate-binding protein